MFLNFFHKSVFACSNVRRTCSVTSDSRGALLVFRRQLSITNIDVAAPNKTSCKDLLGENIMFFYLFVVMTVEEYKENEEIYPKIDC